jgi:hypothetical protein
MRAPSPLEEAGWVAGYAAIARELALEEEAEKHLRVSRPGRQRNCGAGVPRV